MKNKGFMVIVVVLVILTIIIIPVILNITSNSKKGIIEKNLKKYFDTVEQALFEEHSKDANTNLYGTYMIKDEGKKIVEVVKEDQISKEIIVEYNGEKIESGTIKFENGKVSEAGNVKLNNYYASLKSGKITLLSQSQELPGLYKPDGTFVSWNELVSKEDPIIIVSNNIIQDFSWKYVSELSGRLIIPNGIVGLQRTAFKSCWNLTEITIPSSVTKIWDHTFDDCTNLIRINVDAKNPNYTSIDGVLYNKEKTSLIKYPEGKTDSNFTIPSSVTTIENYAFINSSLSEVTIPESVISIGKYTFAHSKNLSKLTIENGLLRIGDYAFEECTSLTELIIPASVTKIGHAAFLVCTSLTSVIVKGNNITVGSSAFSNVPTVYYAGYQEGTDYSSWKAVQVLPLQ